MDCPLSIVPGKVETVGYEKEGLYGTRATPTSSVKAFDAILNAIVMELPAYSGCQGEADAGDRRGG